MISTAEAPSEICDDVPAVCRPSSSTGLSPASPSRVVSRRPWSRVDDLGLAGGSVLAQHRRLERRDLAGEAALVDQATRAFCCEARPNASRSSRVRPRLRAIRSAPSNWLGMSMVQPSGRGLPRPCGTLPPSGIRVIDSTPQAMPTSIVAGRDHVVHQVGGLLAGAALGVDRGGAGALGQSGVQPGPADHVVGLLAGLGDAAADRPGRPSPESRPERSRTSVSACAEQVRPGGRRRASRGACRAGCGRRRR